MPFSCASVPLCLCASEIRNNYFMAGSLTYVTTSGIPGCKWVKSPKSLKLSPKDFNFKPRNWEPIPKEGGCYGAPELADIDNDGDYDLILGYRLTSIIAFFENVGSKYNAIFKLKGTTTIPNSFGHIALGDIDRDGKIDLLSADYSAENIKGYKIISWNILERNPAWDIKPPFPGVLYELTQTLGDLDNDSDLDLGMLYIQMRGWGDGTLTFFFYENTNGKGSWTKRNDWDVWIRHPDIGMGTSWNVSMELVDLYNDGAPDLVYTNEEWGLLQIYPNTGTQSPVWNKDYLHLKFSAYGKILGIWPITDDAIAGTGGFADLDGDSDLDLLRGSADNFCPSYENVGTKENPIFTERQKTYLCGGHVTGRIAFADIDNDCDYEEFLGEGIGSCIGGWYIHRNNGTPEDAYFLGGGVITIPYAYFDDSRPCFVDLDNDGDLDILIGYYSAGNGKCIGAWKNTNNAFEYYPPWDITASFLISQGLDDLETINPWHTLVDLNNDKKYDLIITTEQALCFLENTGTRENATWTRRKDWEKGFECLHGQECNPVRPQAIDIDGDNQEDLIFFTDDAIFAFKRTGTQSVQFERRLDWEDELNSLFNTDGPFGLVDYDNDGDYELVVAYKYAGPALYLNQAPHNPLGTYTSAIFDAGSSVIFENIFYKERKPFETNIAMFVRYGNSPDTLSSWKK
ncbi:MAG: VCBS repeat-containing protein, partial [bacterium]